MAKMTIKDWVKAYKNGDFVSRDHETQVKAGWFDWFCKTEALANKTEAMAKILTRITKPELLGCEAIFANKCPASDHPLYEMMWIQTPDDKEDTVFCISIGDKRFGHRYLVFTPKDYEKPCFECDKVFDLVKYLNA